jgi:hypothetical protein
MKKKLTRKEAEKRIANILAEETNLEDAKERIRSEIPYLHYRPFYEAIDVCGIKHFQVYVHVETDMFDDVAIIGFLDPYDNWTYAKLKNKIKEIVLEFGENAHKEIKKLRQFDYGTNVGCKTYVAVFRMPTHDRIAFAWNLKTKEFVGDAMRKFNGNVLWNSIDKNLHGFEQ